LCHRIVRRKRVQYADAPHALLLRARRNRPCRGRAGEQRYERAARHSITSSARSMSVGGTWRRQQHRARRAREIDTGSFR
jgi:hypothetical protein